MPAVGIMITDGGPHPAEKWAAITASQIIDTASGTPGALLNEARDFQAKVEQVLIRHHTLVQDHENSGLATDGPDRLAGDIDTSGHVPDAVNDIIALASGTSFAAHFARPEVRTYLEQLLHEHFHHSMHIARAWHASEHPDHPAASAFHESATNGVGAFAGRPPGRKPPGKKGA